ncbi:MAG TPA: sigma-70 family RNA polymerase sigma factor [Gaiellaceae bacterium]|nr:sigma-70 family RNA polymerase sigma factor [Gaiellaceae bacterium]
MAVNPVLARAGRLSPEAAGVRLHDLFTEHGRMVYGLCRVLLRDSHDAEDAAQQTFLSAHKSLLGGTHPRDPAAWLAAIARNECRGRARERMREPLLFDEKPEPASDTTEQVVARREEVAALREAMRGLPDQQREAVVLRDFYGLRYDEVGAALGVSGPAVESLLFRARRRLQAELRPLRLASGGLAVPAALRESIAQAIPGFAAAGTGAGGIGLAALLSKAAAVPLAAKVAAAALAVTAAGTSVGIIGSSDRADLRARAAAARVVSAERSAPALFEVGQAAELAAADDNASSPPGFGDEARLERSSKGEAAAGEADAREDEAGAEESGPEVAEDEAEQEQLPQPEILPAVPAGETEADDEAEDSHSGGGDASSGGEGSDDGGEEFASTSSGESSSGDGESSSSRESGSSAESSEPESSDEPEPDDSSGPSESSGSGSGSSG